MLALRDQKLIRHLRSTKVNFPYVSVSKTDLALHSKIYIVCISLNHADYEDRLLFVSICLQVFFNYLKAKNLRFIISICNVIPGACRKNCVTVNHPARD